MNRYAILPHESANRVYAASTLDIAAAELAAVASALLPTGTAETDDAPAASAGSRNDFGDGVAERIEVATLGGVHYLVFDAPELDAAGLELLSDLSTTRALFRMTRDAALVPLEYRPTACFDEDLITIQRYPGKTNERFTHLLVNLTLAASVAARRRIAADQQVRLLDPVAGRGTTLNRALMYGFDATGIEAAAADEDQYRNFITTYLQDRRIKHRTERAAVKHGPLAGTSRFGIEIAGRQKLEFVRGDAAELPALLPNRRFDLIVADLPYGVQHRAASTKESRRSPIDLLHESIGGWRSTMPAGAAIGLSWNVRTLPRPALVEILVDAGRDVIEYPRSFEHVVDRSITRDVIVANA